MRMLAAVVIGQQHSDISERFHNGGSAVIIGIDPGKNGAIAALNSAGVIQWVEKMPTSSDGKGVSFPKLFDLVKDARFVGYEDSKKYMAFLTRNKKKSAASVQDQARNIGTIANVCEMARVKSVAIDPKRWKDAMGVSGSRLGKVASCRLCDLEYPDFKHLWRLPRTRKSSKPDALACIEDDNVCDAILIASYTQRFVRMEERL